MFIIFVMVTISCLSYSSESRASTAFYQGH